jgi:hypothetical protein
MSNKRSIIIQTDRDIYKYYQDFYQFMAQFMANADADIFDDEYTVKESYYKSEYCYQEYLIIKSQAEELMNMEPFPYDAIQDSADRTLAKNAKNEEEKIKMVKDWLIKVLDLLEQRVTGKL